VEHPDLRRAGLKVTGPRLKILEILANEALGSHLSAEAIYRRLLVQATDIGLGTVYRVLGQFEAAGLITRHHFDGETAVYELNRGEHHDHVVCMDCNRVEEFTDDEIESLQSKAAQRLGFEVIDHALILYGRCRRTACPHRLAAAKSEP
jgi:Fur family transcriptional regulator, ferric uptake regulator